MLSVMVTKFISTCYIFANEMKYTRKNSTKPSIVSNKVIGMLDSRATENEALLIKRKAGFSMQKLFGNERKAAVAFFMSDLICKGFNEDEICNIINEKYNLKWELKDVRIMKRLIHKLWRIQTAADMNEQIRQEVAAIDVQIKELWKAWEFSKKGISEKTTRSTNSNSNSDMMDFDQSETILKEDITAGDVKYMNLISELGKEKRKLLGLYAPEKKSASEVQTAVQINVVGGNGEDTIKSVLENCGKTQIDAGTEIVEEVTQLPQYEYKEEYSEYDDEIENIYESIVNGE